MPPMKNGFQPKIHAKAAVYSHPNSPSWCPNMSPVVLQLKPFCMPSNPVQSETERRSHQNRIPALHMHYGHPNQLAMSVHQDPYNTFPSMQPSLTIHPAIRKMLSTWPFSRQCQRASLFLGCSTRCHDQSRALSYTKYPKSHLCNATSINPMVTGKPLLRHCPAPSSPSTHSTHAANCPHKLKA